MMEVLDRSHPRDYPSLEFVSMTFCNSICDSYPYQFWCIICSSSEQVLFGNKVNGGVIESCGHW